MSNHCCIALLSHQYNMDSLAVFIVCNTHICTHAPTHPHAHTHKHTHTQTHTHTNTQHTHTHTHTRAHTHTHTHTGSQRSLTPSFSLTLAPYFSRTIKASMFLLLQSVVYCELYMLSWLPIFSSIMTRSPLVPVQQVDIILAFLTLEEPLQYVRITHGYK